MYIIYAWKLGMPKMMTNLWSSGEVGEMLKLFFFLFLKHFQIAKDIFNKSNFRPYSFFKFRVGT